MPTRQPLPRLWLMTDERLGDGLFHAIGRLPPGAGIVFRHYGLGEVARRDLFERVRAAAPGPVFLAGPASLARAWGADGSHGHGRAARDGFRSAPVHDLAEIRAAERDRADLLFLSPAFVTNSHPGARPLGLARFAWLARRTALPIIALGGMNAQRGCRLAGFGAYGWGAIDAWA